MWCRCRCRSDPALRLQLYVTDNRANLLDQRRDLKEVGTSPADDPVLFQVLEPLGKQIGADLGQPIEKVLEPARTGQQLADDEQGPAVAYPV